MIDENIGNILINSVAGNMQSLNKSFCGSLDKLRKEIIQTHRTVCLLPYYMFVFDSKNRQQKSQSYLPFMSNEELLTSLFKPQENPLFPEISMVAQDASFLINYFENNPLELAKEVINSKNIFENIDYYHLIFQIIPSLFGYFHSSEHLNLATKFYQCVIDLISDNPKDSIRILQPFLSVPATYRYIEYVMSNFFKKIVLCKSQNKNNILLNDDGTLSNKNNISCKNENTKILLHYLAKGASLLPDQILQIFRQIKTKYNDKWTIKNWCKLVFSIFINPHVTRWARSHFLNNDQNQQLNSPKPSKWNEEPAPYSSIPNLYQTPSISINSPSKSSGSKMAQINSILKNVTNEDLLSDLNYYLISLCTVKSTYHPPEMYKCFSNYSIQYYMLINDFIIFVDLLKSRNILPSFIKTGLLHEIPQKYRNVIFYLNVYQSIKPKKAISIDQPIIFPLTPMNPDIIKNFEKQTQYRLRLASLESLAESRNKDRFTFSLENSINDNEFHQYVKAHVCIELANSAQLFEEYIEALRLLNEIEKWRDLSSSCQNFLFLAYSHSLLKIASVFKLLPQKVKLLHQLSIVDESKLQEKLNNVTNFSAEWDCFIHKITSEIDDKLKNNENPNYLKTLIDNSELQVEMKQGDLNVSNQNSAIEIKPINFVENNENLPQMEKLPLYFLRALSIFTQLPVVSLPEKYELLMEFLVIVEEFFPKDDNTLYFLLIQRIPGSILIKIFIEISIIAIHDDLCYNFISNAEKSRWQRLENLIYEIASKNDPMFQKILKAQIEFQKAFESWKNSYFSQQQVAKKNRRFSLVG